MPDILYDREGNEVQVPTQAELAEKEAELEKLKEKDLNFGKLRKTAQEAEKERDEAISAMQNEIKEVTKIVHGNAYDYTLDALSDGDEELKKEIEANYARLTDPADNPKAVQKKLRDAYTLAKGIAPKHESMPMSSGGAPVKIRSNGPIDPALSGIASKMGLSEEDLKQYYARHGRN
jgi:hypothetical protein